MKITVIGVGKIKEKYFTDAIKEYAKRLSRYCKLEIVEVADEKTPDGASETLNAQIKEKEGVRILQKIPENAYVVALAIDGKMLDSEELAAQMERWNVGGISQIVFEMCIRDSQGRCPDRQKLQSYPFQVIDTGFHLKGKRCC